MRSIFLIWREFNMAVIIFFIEFRENAIWWFKETINAIRK